MLKLFLEEAGGFGVFGENNDAGSVAVEAMDDEAEIFEAGFGGGVAFADGQEAGWLIEN